MGSPGQRWTGIANWQEVKPVEEGRAQRSGAEGSSGLASLCLPLLSLPCQAANGVTQPPRLPWAHRAATCHSPWGRARKTVGRRWTAQAAPSLLRLTDLGWGLKEPWELGVRALSACGVMDLGPQTADPDARSPSTSGGAATMCWSWWSRPRLQAGECAQRPRESALPWAGGATPPLMCGVTSPPPFPWIIPITPPQAFPRRGGRLFLWRPFPRWAGWRGRLCTPTLL